MHTCLNCGNTYEKNFCNECGQKAVKRFSIKGVLHDLPHSVFHVDKGLLKNIKSVLHPQESVFGYIRGKRVSFFNPVLFFLITLGFIMLVEHSMEKELEYVMNMEAWDGEMHDVGAILSKNFKYMLLFASFLFALPSYFLYKKSSGFNYAEQVVSYIFIMGYMNVVYLLFLPFPFTESYPFNYIALASLLLFTGLVFRQKSILLSLIKPVIIIGTGLSLFIIFNVCMGFLVILIQQLSH
jgi:hypothetical protein